MAFSIRGVIEALPIMPLHSMAGSWLRAVELLLSNPTPDERAAAELMIRLMHEEWDRRRAAPREGDLAEHWPVDAKDRPGSPMSAHGYHVGRRSDLPTVVRHEILRRCVEEPLMPAFPPEALAEWGAPHSVTRLKAVLDLIDNQIRNNFTQADKQIAVREWRADLRFLHGLYGDRAGVRWPAMEDRQVRFVG